jgi:AraC-like DNA-binding protein
MEALFSLLIYAGIVQGFYMAFLLNHNKRRNPANKYLILLLLGMSISIAHSVFVIPEIYKSLDVPLRYNEPLLMLIIPLIWLYVKKLEQPLFQFKLEMLTHFLPFLVFMSVNVPALIHGSGSLPAHFLVGYSVWFYGIIWAALLVQYSIYLLQIVRITRNLKSRAQQELSNVEHVDISWLNTFLYAFILVFIIIAIMFVGAIHNFGGSWMNQLVSLVFAIAIFILGYKGLFQQSIFSNVEAVEQTELTKNESVKTKLVDPDLLHSLLHYMEAYTPHRNSELSLTMLAGQIGMSRNQLSEVINNNIGCNFYDFVNKFRIEDVKQLMADPKYKDFTILAIAYEAGFPSKSTFNSVFKKFTGLTPSEYKIGLR